MSTSGIYTVEEENEDVEEMLVLKAQELFEMCDKELKGFITKSDMQKFSGELQLSVEQINEVFDALDEDSSGALTLEEFKIGFALFLGLGNQSSENSKKRRDQKNFESDESESEKSVNEDEQFYELLDTLGARDILGDENDVVRNMWRQLKKDDQLVVCQFENFLSHVVGELKRSQTEYTDLETIFKNRSNIYDAEVRRLFEEMEQAVETERKKLLSEEKLKERKRRLELEEELQHKNNYLQELVQKQNEFEKRLKDINSIENETKQENAKLQQEKDELEQRLASSEKMLNDLRANMGTLKQSEVKEKRNRLKSALKVTEGIALEREGLVKQLDMLRNVNKQLLDEQDAVILASQDQRTPEIENCTGSVASINSTSADMTCEISSRVIPFESQISKENIYTAYNGQRKNEKRSFKFNPFEANGRRDYEVDESYYNSASYLPDDASEYSYVSFDSENNQLSPSHRRSNYKGINPFLQNTTTNKNEFCSSPFDEISLGKEVWRVRTSFESDADGETQVSDASSNPERIFKVVFIGDSGVGKSSFIHRFCNDDFRSTFSATIGVDFQVKSVNVDGHFVALQLWDTAGQERFRSITKQYYRKADGVIIMFDITSEMSFKNVMGWMNDVKDGADDNTVLMVVGNKTDLCIREESRVIKGRDGEHLANEYGALFFETSAKLGEGVEDSMLAMSVLLQQREDEHIERSLKLQETALKKRKCCKS